MKRALCSRCPTAPPMGRESKDFYKQIPLRPMPYGQAMAILFLMEAEAQKSDARKK